eukprot:gnl/Chilomastix_caulleri/1470.p1 GENE.gnl/Chilomastix_caulleri/1470~~gnl/Chilomastix_caulleri/1470.p1  ORF type:complete len:143 (+),score=23.74 gnl/Chilomastix_caulleri/1470:198-626(+)
MGILDLGLEIAPDAARNTGKRLGLGVYLTDHHKRAKLFTSRGVTGSGFMFVVEAAYKKAYELKDPNNFKVMSPTLQPIGGTDATILRGKYEPTEKGQYHNGSNIPFPIGKFKATGIGCSEPNTEYCIYDRHHLKLRYLAVIK